MRLRCQEIVQHQHERQMKAWKIQIFCVVTEKYRYLAQANLRVHEEHCM